MTDEKTRITTVARYCVNCGGTTKHYRVWEYNAFAWPQHIKDVCQDCGKVL